MDKFYTYPISTFSTEIRRQSSAIWL